MTEAEGAEGAAARAAETDPAPPAGGKEYAVYSVHLGGQEVGRVVLDHDAQAEEGEAAVQARASRTFRHLLLAGELLGRWDRERLRELLGPVELLDGLALLVATELGRTVAAVYRERAAREPAPPVRPDAAALETGARFFGVAHKARVLASLSEPPGSGDVLERQIWQELLARALADAEDARAQASPGEGGQAAQGVPARATELTADDPGVDDAVARALAATDLAAAVGELLALTAHRLVQRVAKEQPLEDLPLHELARALGLLARPGMIAERRTPFTPFALTLLSDPHTQAGVRSMWAPLEWKRPAQGPPFYRDKNQVLVYAKDAGDIVLSLDDAKANAFIICLGKWWAETSGDPAWPRDCRVYVEDVLAFRGIKKHSRGGYEAKQKEAVKEDILALRHLWVRSHQQVWETTRRGGRRLVDVDVDDPLVEVSIESTVDLWGERAPYAVRFRPGGWARHYLGDGTHWTTPVLKTVMGYDPRYDRIKMRLGIYLAFQWRIRARTDNWDQPWKLQTLLEGAKLEGAKPEPAVRNPQRFYPRVVAALGALREDGVLAVCEALDFPDWRPPADTPPKVWVPELLAGRWRLLPAAAARARLPRGAAEAPPDPPG